MIRILSTKGCPAILKDMELQEKSEKWQKSEKHEIKLIKKSPKKTGAY